MAESSVVKKGASIFLQWMPVLLEGTTMSIYSQNTDVGWVRKAVGDSLKGREVLWTHLFVFVLFLIN
jgi:hypothetical protein